MFNQRFKNGTHTTLWHKVCKASFDDPTSNGRQMLSFWARKLNFWYFGAFGLFFPNLFSDWKYLNWVTSGGQKKTCSQACKFFRTYDFRQASLNPAWRSHQCPPGGHVTHVSSPHANGINLVHKKPGLPWKWSRISPKTGHEHPKNGDLGCFYNTKQPPGPDLTLKPLVDMQLQPSFVLWAWFGIIQPPIYAGKWTQGPNSTK